MAMSTWLDEHLETFVRPHLGEVPNVDIKYNRWFEVWTSGVYKRSLQSLYLNWTELKKKNDVIQRTIMFPGRDMWEMEILARMEGYPTVFRPDISSITCTYVKENYRKHLVVDTGYSGSIPKTLKAEKWLLIHHSTERNLKNKVHQIFSKALDYKENSLGVIIRQAAPVLQVAASMECSPKYWTRGALKIDSSGALVKPFEIVQGFSGQDEFRGAAQITQWIAKKGKI